MRQLAIAASLVLAVAATAEVAHARPGARPARATAPYKITVQRGVVTVRAGKRSAPLVRDDDYDTASARFDVGRKLAHVRLTTLCQVPHQLDFTFDQLEARLVNALALRAHQAGRYDEAIAGFTQAVALDPTWRLPAINLASALNLKGDAEAAVTALAPWLDTEPGQTYLRIANDPELASLLGHARVQAIAATAPGTVELAADGLKGEVAYSPALDAIAVTRAECNWGADGCDVTLELFDARTGDQLVALPLVSMDDEDDFSGAITATARPAIDARVARLQIGLRGLGFAPAAVERGASRTDTSDDGELVKQRVSFAKAKLGIVIKDGRANLVRGNTSLATGDTLDHLGTATWVDAAHVAVVWSQRPGAEGCEGTDPSLVTVLPGR